MIIIDVNPSGLTVHEKTAYDRALIQLMHLRPLEFERVVAALWSTLETREDQIRVEMWKAADAFKNDFMERHNNQSVSEILK